MKIYNNKIGYVERFGHTGFLINANAKNNLQRVLRIQAGIIILHSKDAEYGWDKIGGTFFLDYAGDSGLERIRNCHNDEEKQ